MYNQPIETSAKEHTSADISSSQHHNDPQIEGDLDTNFQSTPSRHIGPTSATLVVSRYFRLFGKAIKTLMNAAVTIFGLGVGVGLILGDSLRARPTNPSLEVPAEGVAAAMPMSDDTSIPLCGVQSRRTVHVTLPRSTAASILPAQ